MWAMIIAAVVIVIGYSVLKKRRKRRPGYIPNPTRDLSEYEIDSDGTARSKAVREQLKKRTVDEIAVIVQAASGGNPYLVEDILAEEYYPTFKESVGSGPIQPVKVLSVTADDEVESSAAGLLNKDLAADSEIIFISGKIELSCTTSCADGKFTITNYNTPYTGKYLIAYSRRRRKPGQHSTCPKCGAPIFGDSCITCNPGENHLGWRVCKFSIL